MKIKLLTILLSFLFSINFTAAHGNKESHHSSHDSIEKKEEIIKAQLIGLTCFIKHDSKGEEHKDCFKECAEKGLPIGILTKENKIKSIRCQELAMVI